MLLKNITSSFGEDQTNEEAMETPANQSRGMCDRSTNITSFGSVVGRALSSLSLTGLITELSKLLGAAGAKVL